MKDWMSETARRLNPELPKDWRWVMAESVKGGSLLQGGVCKTGPRGKTIWPRVSAMDKVIIQGDDIKETQRLYEVETGLCHYCEGTKEWTYGHSIDLGPKKKPCPRCNATGVAP